MGERGWLAPDWPPEYGGLGKTRIEAAIVSEELGFNKVPDIVHAVSIIIVGQFLLLAGTEEQKRQYLRPMARGELVSTVLYSEPDTGSDLASLSTRAKPEGDGYCLYGTKIYSQTTEHADYGLVAARTMTGKTKYEGITLFLVPLHAKGVQVRPMWNISDDRFSEVVLDGVWVPRNAILGSLHGGWRLLSAALSLERTGLDFYVKMWHWLDLIADHACATGRIAEPWVRQQLATLEAQVEAGRLLAWRTISQLARGEVNDVTAAMSKWYNTEIGRGLVRLGVEMDGMDGLLTRWDGEAPMDGVIEAAYREVPGLTLSAGTSEIMLYLIAAAGLKVYE
jgi:alkylation response protein AidB-like acyl-CoA dehydrogenase